MFGIFDRRTSLTTETASTTVNTQVSIAPKCSGCGKNVMAITMTRYTLAPGAYIGGTPKQLIFCRTCMDHIRKNGPMFFTTYSFGYHSQNLNNND